MSTPTSGAGSEARDGRARLALPVGVLLLIVAMALTIAGIPVPPLFRPGTWLILVGLALTAAGAALRLTGVADDA